MRQRLYFIILFMLCLLGTVTVQAQNDFTLHGRVTDSNGNPIEFAIVAIASQGKSTMTNLQGQYTLKASTADSVTVRFSMVGYKTKTRVLRKPKGTLTLQVHLFDDNTLGEVTVVEERRQTDQTQKLDVEDVKQGPTITGNVVEEMVQTQAGVSTHSELSSQYNVRGGTFDENSVYINNVEIYRPFLVRSGQQEGLSIINPDMVENVQFSTGGFDARFGDKMSSALSITYKKPRPFEAAFTASMLGGSAYVGFSNKNFSWQNGVRYKTNRMLLGSLDEKGEYRPNFFDYQSYLTYEPSKRWKIEILGDIANNHYNFTPESRETKFGTLENVKSFKVYFDGHEKDIFRTYFGSVGLTYNIAEKTKLQFSASAFHTNEQEKYDIQGQYWLTQTETSENLGVGTYFEHTRDYLEATVKSFSLNFWNKSRKHETVAGLTYKIERIKEFAKEYEMRDSAGYSMPHTGQDLYMIYSFNARNKLRANRVEAFIQDSYKFSSAGEHAFFTLNYGLRFAHWNFNHESIVSPRVSLAMVPAFNNDVTLRFATGLYYQSPFYKELRDTITTEGITIARLNDKIKSQQSIHFIAAMDYRFKMMDRKFKFSAEAYYKLLHNLIPYSVNNVKIVYDASQQVSGHAMGLDMKLYGEFVAGTDSWLTFSLMNTRMNIPQQSAVSGQQSSTRSVPMPSDQRYAINLYFTDYFPGTDRWKMALKLAYADGLPFGAPHRRLSDMPFRAPAYRRVDIGMSYRLLNNEQKIKDWEVTSRKKRGQRPLLRNVWLGVDCLNLLGINNVNSYYWITDVTNHQYAVPNYLTGRQLNFKLQVEF